MIEAFDHVRHLAAAHHLARALHVVAELGVADLVGAEGTPIDVVALGVGADQDAFVPGDAPPRGGGDLRARWSDRPPHRGVAAPALRPPGLVAGVRAARRWFRVPSAWFANHRREGHAERDTHRVPAALSVTVFA